jgi:hypothetical protein
MKLGIAHLGIKRTTSFNARRRDRPVRARQTRVDGKVDPLKVVMAREAGRTFNGSGP